MTEPSLEEMRKQINTPAGFILMWAFNLACDANELLRKELPQIAEYQNGKAFGNLLQVATIIATLLRMERYLGSNDYTTLHRSIAQSIAPSVRHIYVPPLQDLASFILQAGRVSFGENEIPDFNALLSQDEDKLATLIATWIVWKMKTEKPSNAFDLRLVAVLAKLVYTTNAQLIASMLLSDKNSLNRIV